MSQPAAAAKIARITPRWVMANVAPSKPVIQPCTRESTSRGLSPPCGRKSQPRASFSCIAAPSALRRSASRLPSHSPQLISAMRGSRSARGAPSSAAVSTQRASGLVMMRMSLQAAGSRNALSAARPASLSGGSARPWMRPSALQAVSPWRSSASRTIRARRARLRGVPTRFRGCAPWRRSARPRRPAGAGARCR